VDDHLGKMAPNPASTSNCAILLGINSVIPGGLSPAEASVALQKLLPKSSPVGPFHDWFPRGDREAFQKKLMQVITRIRMALIQADPALKADNAELRDAAVSQCIPVDSLAVITGPGGGSQ
jgi:hypothetical protein